MEDKTVEKVESIINRANGLIILSFIAVIIVLLLT